MLRTGCFALFAGVETDCISLMTKQKSKQGPRSPFNGILSLFQRFGTDQMIKRNVCKWSSDFCVVLHPAINMYDKVVLDRSSLSGTILMLPFTVRMVLNNICQRPVHNFLLDKQLISAKLGRDPK